MTDPAIPVASLRDYVQHKPECQRDKANLIVHDIGEYEPGACTCGLAALLAEPVIPQSEQEQDASDRRSVALRKARQIIECVIAQHGSEVFLGDGYAADAVLQQSIAGAILAAEARSLPPPEPVQALIAKIEALAAEAEKGYDDRASLQSTRDAWAAQAKAFRKCRRLVAALLAVPPDPSEHEQERKGETRVDEALRNLSSAARATIDASCIRNGVTDKDECVHCGAEWGEAHVSLCPLPWLCAALEAATDPVVRPQEGQTVLICRDGQLCSMRDTCTSLGRCEGSFWTKLPPSPSPGVSE